MEGVGPAAGDLADADGCVRVLSGKIDVHRACYGRVTKPVTSGSRAR